ncbi:unnamed protein product [Schistocephalus solidus]|uniref:CUE domain-containing protein n=1 Tax=Schistocephalus solidus TaxID=70667 RepID=A0A183TAA5_SCHSO|nr:unnamed protein product [Schistocephalus solidus]
MMSSTLYVTQIQPKYHEERSLFACNFKDRLDSPNVDVFDAFATALSESKCETLSRADISKILNPLELDAPLVDYLVAHGAISAEMAKELLRWECFSERETSKIETLLDCLEIFDKSVQNIANDAHVVVQNPKLILLINALRSTGQHALASRLDSGPRILPSRFTTSPGTTDADYDPAEDVALKYHGGAADNFGPHDVTIAPSGKAKTSQWELVLPRIEPVHPNASLVKVIVLIINPPTLPAGSLGDARGSVRRRGQLRLWLQVAAIKVNPARYEELILPPTGAATLNADSRPRRGRWKAPGLSEDLEPVKQ